MPRLLLSVMVATGLLWPAGSALGKDKPFNRVAVLVDASGSYAGRQPEAIEAVGKLLGAMGQTNLRRWEAADEIVIISLDAMPEVVWRGSVRNLAEDERQRWVERFKARRDFAGCTDVVTGFKVAARELAKSPEPAARYLWIYSDLKAEPPASSASVCKPVSRPGPPAGFPWDTLRGISVAAFWVPVNQKLAWKRAIDEQGEDLQVALYAESESGAVSVLAPPRARRIQSDDQKAEVRTHVTQAAWTVGRWLLTIALTGVGAIAGLGMVALVLSQRARRRGVPAHESRS